MTEELEVERGVARGVSDGRTTAAGRQLWEHRQRDGEHARTRTR